MLCVKAGIVLLVVSNIFAEELRHTKNHKWNHFPSKFMGSMSLMRKFKQFNCCWSRVYQFPFTSWYGKMWSHTKAVLILK